MRQGTQGDHRAYRPHNVINADAHEAVLGKAGDDVVLILGVELHIKANDPKPYHAHVYFNSEPTAENIAAINELLDKLYPNKLPNRNDAIPTLPNVLNSLQKYEFLFLPHGGQAHGTFDRAIGKDERFDDLMMRVTYNFLRTLTAE